MRGRLAGLEPDERRAVEETARAIGQSVAGCLLEEAASDEAFASVLAALYPVGKGWRSAGLESLRGPV